MTGTLFCINVLSLIGLLHVDWSEPVHIKSVGLGIAGFCGCSFEAFLLSFMVCNGFNWPQIFWIIITVSCGIIGFMAMGVDNVYPLKTTPKTKDKKPKRRKDIEFSLLLLYLFGSLGVVILGYDVGSLLLYIPITIIILFLSSFSCYKLITSHNIFQSSNRRAKT